MFLSSSNSAAAAAKSFVGENLRSLVPSPAADDDYSSPLQFDFSNWKEYSTARTTTTTNDSFVHTASRKLLGLLLSLCGFLLAPCSRSSQNGGNRTRSYCWKSAYRSSNKKKNKFVLFLILTISLFGPNKYQTTTEDRRRYSKFCAVAFSVQQPFLHAQKQKQLKHLLQYTPMVQQKRPVHQRRPRHSTLLYDANPDPSQAAQGASNGSFLFLQQQSSPLWNGASNGKNDTATSTTTTTTVSLNSNNIQANGVSSPTSTANGVSSPTSTSLHNHNHNGVTYSSTFTRAPLAPSIISPSVPPLTPEAPLHWTELIIAGSTTNTNSCGSRTSSWSAVASARTSVCETILSEYDIQQIERYWEELLPSVNYLGTECVAKIYQALCVAYRAHRGQMRKSGDPFIIHPVQVALLLANLKMDAQTVIAGLLHDTVEDTELTFPQVEALFGREVRSIVEGETKVSKLPKLAATTSTTAVDDSRSDKNGGKSADGAATTGTTTTNNVDEDEQAENLRQMFVAMTDDYRIIIVKLADRLHNMRTLRHMKPHKQIKISRETLDIFAPLAHRMGIWQFKSELEDTAFMYLYPNEYKALHRRLRQHQTKFRETLDKSKLILQRQIENDPTLRQQAASVEVYGRTKEIYSLWHKMTTKGIDNLDHIVDVVALRVIITPKEEPASPQVSDFGSSYNAAVAMADRGVWLCYHVLGLVQHLPGFQPVPTRVKDYISFPKPNGYQSLHTALFLNGQTIEVQIRTKMMHQVAEYGMASHWAYTEQKRSQRAGDENEMAASSKTTSRTGEHDSYNTPWLSSIKEWQNDRISSRDFVDTVRRELLGKRVFVFLRNGKILNLSRGATAIDAAFQIHTEVGLNMHGVEINGKTVPFSYELQNGDVVSILIGEGGKPSTDWMLYAKSRSTRSKLRSYFRQLQRETMREAGKIILLDYLAMHAPLIQRSSYLQIPQGENRTNDSPPPGSIGAARPAFVAPTTLEEVEAFLPGKTRYNDIDELLLVIAKHHDRSILHKLISQLLEVPKKLLAQAEENKQVVVPSTVVAAVHERRRHDKTKIKLHNSDDNDDASDGRESFSFLQASKPAEADLKKVASTVPNGKPYATKVEPTEYADPDYICEDCLPVHGDQIIGTRRPNNDATTTVHRLGCPHALRAVHQASARRRQQVFQPPSLADSIIRLASSFTGTSPSSPSQVGSSSSYRTPKVDSVSLRMERNQRTWTRYKSTKSKLYSTSTSEVPVNLVWSDLGDESATLFLTEVVVHAVDRKLLLADCSEVVSETAEIVKTGSASTNEHASLVFLVKVSGLDQLQLLMDRLLEIKSVMSVERRFGSELL